MRQIILDTETTGLDPAQGHRIIEIGCVEMIDRRVTDNRYHQYLQPDREIDDGALEVHGITPEFLADKPRFRDVVEDFLGYVKGAELIIHNAPFDVGFINHELSLAGKDKGKIEDYCVVIDTLKMARGLHPSQNNSLDGLCRRYEIDNSQRTLHGALLDAEILSDVFLALTGGQTTLSLDGIESVTSGRVPASTIRRLGATKSPTRVIRANAEELAAHATWLDHLDQAEDGCLWKKLNAEGASQRHES